jgi:hypothetical protein
MADLGNVDYWRFLAQNGAVVSLEYLTLVCWSWTMGFVIASLCPRTSLVTGALFSMVWLSGELGALPYQPGANDPLFSQPFYRDPVPVILMGILVLTTAWWGMRHGVRVAIERPRLRAILWTAATATLAVITIQTWLWVSRGVYNGRSVPDFWPIPLLGLIVYWPVAYLAASAIGRHNFLRRRTHP